MRFVWLLVILLVPACGPGGSPLFFVRGKVVITGGDVKTLAGGNVEASLESDANFRASGEIQADGTFQLESYREGKLVKGTIEGRYRVRVLPPSDDPATERRARGVLAARYQKFETSGLTFVVPTGGDVVLELNAR